MRRALGHPAVVAAEGRTVRAARRRHDPGDRQRRHRLRHPRPSSSDRDRDHHLPRLRRRVVGAAAVRRAGRSRRHVPRPAPARAAADVRPAAHRRRLRRWPRSARSRTILFAFSFLPQVVLFVGNMLVSDSALDYFTGHLDVLWKVPVAVLAARRVLRGHRCRDRVADRPPDRRRRGGHRAVPRHVDLVGHHRRRGLRVRRRLGRRAHQRAGVAAVPARPRVPRPHRSRVAAQRRRQRRAARRRDVRRRARSSASACCCAATAGWNADVVAPSPTRATPVARPGVRGRRDRRGRRRLGVVRAEGRAVRAQLLVRPGSDRPARAQRRRQDDADAGDHRSRRRQPGHGARSRAATRVATAQVHGRMALVPEDEAVPAGLTARQFVRYVADLHGVADRERARRRAADRRDARRRRPAGRRRSARACASAPRSPPRS